MELEGESALEKISGSVITTIAGTLLAAFSGTPLAALLPALTNTLASNRHKERVKRGLKDICDILRGHEAILAKLTDSQYKLINEFIIITLQTTEEEKLKYLKAAIKNTLASSKLKDLEAAQLSRLIRDISAEEIIFLLNHRKYSTIVFDQQLNESSVLNVQTNSIAGETVTGLISMGLIIPGASTMASIGNLRYSPLVGKLLNLVAN